MFSTTAASTARRIASKQRPFTALRSISRSSRNSVRKAYLPSEPLPHSSTSIRTFTSTTPQHGTPMAAETDTQAESIQNTTGITPSSLTEALKSSPALNASHVDIQDISGGCGASFAALIVSDAFQGKSALQRHRLVNGILKDEIKAIHAWTPKCLTPEQWEKERAKMQ